MASIDGWLTSRALALALAAGSSRVAARVSGDRGDSFIYCDLNTGDGSNDSEDGFTAENAGQVDVFVRVDPCSPNPCVADPVDRCDGDFVSVSDADGVCTVVAELAECVYGEAIVEDCAAAGFQCEAAWCVSDVRAPSADELVITEIMPVTNGDVWFELTSVTDTQVNLDGCSFLGSCGTTDIVRPLLIEAGQQLLFASGDATV
jgi:hypothetical protein